MGSQDSDDDVPALLSAKPQLTRAPARIGARGAPRGQMVDPNSIPAGCVHAILLVRQHGNGLWLYTLLLAHACKHMLLAVLHDDLQYQDVSLCNA